jgi:hypothetical protein
MRWFAGEGGGEEVKAKGKPEEDGKRRPDGGTEEEANKRRKVRKRGHAIGWLLLKPEMNDYTNCSFFIGWSKRDHDRVRGKKILMFLATWTQLSHDSHLEALTRGSSHL